MLYLYLGEINREGLFGDKYLRLPQKYFDYNYMDEWFEHETVKDLVKKVDQSDVISSQTILSPVLGQIPPVWLSTGVKSLILMYEEDWIISGERLGDNCWDHVYELSKSKDITVPLNHIFLVSKVRSDFSATVVNAYNREYTRDEIAELWIQVKYSNIVWNNLPDAVKKDTVNNKYEVCHESGLL